MSVWKLLVPPQRMAPARRVKARANSPPSSSGKFPTVDVVDLQRCLCPLLWRWFESSKAYTGESAVTSGKGVIGCTDGGRSPTVHVRRTWPLVAAMAEAS